MRSAAVLHDRGDYIRSITILKRVLQQSPRSYQANLLLGEDLFRVGRSKEALRPLEIASNLHPEDGAAEVYLAQAAAQLNDYSTASEALMAALHRSNNSAPFLEQWASYCLDRVQTIGPHLRTVPRGEAVALRIEAAFHSEGTEVREKLLAQSAAEDPAQREIWGELGTAQLELGLHSGAMDSLKKARASEPDANGTLELEGLFAAVEGDWPTAQVKLTALAARSPTEFRSAQGEWLHVLAPKYAKGATGWPCLSDPAHACPASLLHPAADDGLSQRDLYKQGRWEQLAALSRTASNDVEQDLWHGVALAEIGQCLSAIPLLETGMKKDELAAGFWLDVCYANQGNAALASLRKVGDKLDVDQLEGDIQMHLHDNAAAAEAHYAEALKADPQNARLLERSAEAYLRMGDTEHATQSALSALAVDPHNAFATKTLATIAIQRREYADALGRLQQLFQMEPQDRWTRVELGVSYAQLGQPERALPYLQQELTAGYPDTKGALHAQLAAVLRKLGKDEQAKQAAAEAERLANLSLQNLSVEPSSAPH